MQSSMLMNALLLMPQAVRCFNAASGEADYKAAALAACAADATCRLQEGLPDPHEHKTEDDAEGFGLFPERMPMQLLSTEAKTLEKSERLSEEELTERMARLRREFDGLEQTLANEATRSSTERQQTSGGGSPTCDSPCTFKRQTHTCRERIQWVKDHWDVATFQDPSGYGKSLEIVNGNCAGQCECNPYDFGGVYVKDILPPLTKLVCQGLDVGCPAPPPPPPRPTPKPTPAPPTAAPRPTPRPANGTATPAPTPKPVKKAGACSDDDFQRMKSLGAGSKKGTFAETVSTCARGAYSLWYGLSADKDKGCLRKKVGVSAGCADCIHKANQFGTKNCKVACIKSWCSESCLKCSGGAKAELESCTGGELPRAEVCVASAK
eukprot:TRINITY_DN3197_c0_g2_i1.p1 TRINITY_DN3197_c0_g2~~TRINITY_DN3197_c0_g2_i1.p1  ORF type:complete len:412 (-),score=100.60 TRINITY_DN3197_c0_g2_i1:346-1485(-)